MRLVDEIQGLIDSGDLDGARSLIAESGFLDESIFIWPDQDFDYPFGEEDDEYDDYY